MQLYKSKNTKDKNKIASVILLANSGFIKHKNTGVYLFWYTSAFCFMMFYSAA